MNAWVIFVKAKIWLSLLGSQRPTKISKIFLAKIFFSKEFSQHFLKY